VTTARKVYTESMIRDMLRSHFEVDPYPPHSSDTYSGACLCGWVTSRTDADKAFEDHFIDQLHKRWHETIGNRTPTKEVVGVG
jgi:hypothetical protein